MPLRPSFTSVTYGAGGLSRERTARIVSNLRTNFGNVVLPHLTCIGHRRSEILELSRAYSSEGITDLLALHGDSPSDGRLLPQGDFRYAVELISFLREQSEFSLGVAAHPEGHPMARDRRSDRDHQAAKLKMADFAICQFFFEAHCYFDFMEEMTRRGIDTPVLPGIIPVTNFEQTQRMLKMAGGSFPSDLARRFERAKTPEESRAIGVQHATNLASELLAGGAPGLHFYPINRWMATAELFNELGIIRTS